MSEAEACRLAEAEGLQLVPSDNAAGFKSVTERPGNFGDKRFHAAVTFVGFEGGKHHSLGCFTGVYEAALAYARYLGPELSTRMARAAASNSQLPLPHASTNQCPKDARCSRAGNHTGLCKLWKASRTEVGAASVDAPLRTNLNRSGKVTGFDVSSKSQRLIVRTTTVVDEDGSRRRRRDDEPTMVSKRRRLPDEDEVDEVAAFVIAATRVIAATQRRPPLPPLALDRDDEAVAEDGHVERSEDEVVQAFAMENQCESNAEAVPCDASGLCLGERSPVWMRSPAAAISHVEAASALAKEHAAAAAEAVARATEDDTDREWGSEQCCISGCKTQLLRCGRLASDAVSSAQDSHILCAPCLERWFVSRNQIREEHGLSPLARRKCPICQSELRMTGALRANAIQYALGLPKVEGTW